MLVNCIWGWVRGWCTHASWRTTTSGSGLHPWSWSWFIVRTQITAHIQNCFMKPFIHHFTRARLETLHSQISVSAWFTRVCRWNWTTSTKIRPVDCVATLTESSSITSSSKMVGLKVLMRVWMIRKQLFFYRMRIQTYLPQCNSMCSQCVAYKTLWMLSLMNCNVNQLSNTTMCRYCL